jgi:hypothetical protein
VRSYSTKGKVYTLAECRGRRHFDTEMPSTIGRIPVPSLPSAALKGCSDSDPSAIPHHPHLKGWPANGGLWISWFKNSWPLMKTRLPHKNWSEAVWSGEDGGIRGWFMELKGRGSVALCVLHVWGTDAYPAHIKVAGTDGTRCSQGQG